MSTVPDTNTFSLQNVFDAVKNHTPATTGNLQSCFDNSIAGYFDPAYGSKTMNPKTLYGFRNYKPIITVTVDLALQDDWDAVSILLGGTAQHWFNMVKDPASLQDLYGQNSLHYTGWANDLHTPPTTAMRRSYLGFDTGRFIPNNAVIVEVILKKHSKFYVHTNDFLNVVVPENIGKIDCYVGLNNYTGHAWKDVYGSLGTMFSSGAFYYQESINISEFSYIQKSPHPTAFASRFTWFVLQHRDWDANYTISMGVPNGLHSGVLRSDFYEDQSFRPVLTIKYK